MTTIKRGSEWRKWDLHFHTPASYDYKKGSITNQEIIDGLASKQISVIAITDHHVIDLDRIIELQTLGKAKAITVLPGIEFLAELRGGSDPIHFIGIFPENAQISFIWKQIESKTNISKMEGEGKKANEVYCDLLDTAKLITETGGIVTIHAGTKSNSIENLTNALPHAVALKVDTAAAVDIFEMGKETDCVDYQKMVIPFLKKAIDKHHPLIICSDNHQIDDYIVKQNLWIKGDPTFEGLKQIIFEPAHRVKIQADKPDFKENKLVIDHIRFIGSGNKFNTQPIYLNDNLNVIIGGKSSGKSILLYHIAKTLLSDADFLKKEGIDNKYNFKEQDDAFNFEITTKGGFSQKLFRNADENSVIPEIKYIPQNYLVKLAESDENKTGSALNKIVRDLINEDPESQKAYSDFLSEVKAYDRNREVLIDNYFEIEERIGQLEGQLRLKSNKDILDQNILTNTTKVNELNKSTGMTPAQMDEYNAFQKDLEDNKLLRTQALNDFKKITEFNTEALNTFNNLKNKKQLVSSSLENGDLKNQFDTAYLALETAITSLQTFAANFDLVKNDSGGSRFNVAGPVSDVFKEYGDRQKDLEAKLEPFLKNQEVKNQIEEIVKSIGADKAALQSIQQLTKEIADNRKALASEKDKIFALYEQTYRAYLEVINKLKVRTVDLEKDGLKIEGVPAFNFQKFKKQIFGFSDGRTASYSLYKICDDKLDSLSEYVFVELLAELRSMFESIAERNDYALTGKTQAKSSIKTLLEDYFFDYWHIEYKGDRLGKMSTGKASFVILMLIVGLSKSKAPILIDQPEDNLDNRSITSDLVEYLKDKKLERQIILVTHNANIVVNADAENVIIAHQMGQGDVETESDYQFDYTNGPLENTFAIIETEKDLLKSMGIREHIADIVEGGKDAFKKREEKYGFKEFK